MDFPLVSMGLAQRDPTAFAVAVCSGLHRYGFLAVEDHGVDLDLIDEAERQTAKLYGENDPVKIEELYGHPEIFRQRASSPMEAEQAEGYGVADAKTFWMTWDDRVNPENPADNPFGGNIWPTELCPDFEGPTRALTAEYHRVGFTILRGIEIGYGFDMGALTNMTVGAQTMLRSIFYPSRRNLNLRPGARRSAAHKDINVLTVLRAKPGLWAKINGVWVRAEAPSHALWINTGEMIAEVEAIRRSDYPLVPTEHCVGNPDGSIDEGEEDFSRVNIPLFFHFLHSQYLRRPKPGFGDKGLKVKDWFDQRIREITKK